MNRYGWNNFFKESFEKINSGEFEFGRIIVENKSNYLVATKHGEIKSELTGKLMFSALTQSELPKVGDWVALSLYDNNSLGIIHELIERKTKLSRKHPDKKIGEQIIASNVDRVFIVQSLDETFNLNRIERYLAAVNQSKAIPSIILTKSDLCDDLDSVINSIKIRNISQDIFVLSSITNNGIEELSKNIKAAETIVFIGPSGVGKTTLLNKLMGEEIFETREVRESDKKGKHTTTKRQLVLIPSGGILIDTPGMREFALWNSSDGISETFNEFDEYSSQCKYEDCSHIHETGCAVIEAVENNTISEQRYKNYLKLIKEMNYLERKSNESAALIEKKKWKNIHKEIKRTLKTRKGR